MTSQETVMEEMSKAVINVRKLRERLRHVDSTLVRQSLNIISCERIKNNKQMVLEKLRLMATVHQTQPMVSKILIEGKTMGTNLCLLSRFKCF